jgi:hypothetical protein
MLPRLQAERQLAAIEAASFPEMSRNDRREVLRKYQRESGRDQKAARATEADLAAMPITVEYVTADGRPDERDETGRETEVTDER